MANLETLKGSWNEVKGKLQEKWGQLTSDDLRVFNGNVDQLVGMIQRKTGEGREAIQQFLDNVTTEGSAVAGRAAETARQYVTQAADSVSTASQRAAEEVRRGYANAESMVQARPGQSVGVAFGAGLVAGVLLAVMLRSR